MRLSVMHSVLGPLSVGLGITMGVFFEGKKTPPSISTLSTNTIGDRRMFLVDAIVEAEEANLPALLKRALEDGQSPAALHLLVARWVALHPLQALEQLQTLRDVDRKRLVPLVFAYWAGIDADVAIAQARRLKDEEMRHVCLAHIEPELAFGVQRCIVALELQGFDIAPQVSEEISRQWHALTETVAARVDNGSFLLDLPPALQRTVVSMAAQQVSSEKGTKYGLEWASRIPDDETKVMALVEVLGRGVAEDLEYLKSAPETFPSVRRHDEAMEVIAAAMLKQEGFDSAVAWLREKAEGRVASKVHGRLLSELFQFDLTSAAEYTTEYLQLYGSKGWTPSAIARLAEDAPRQALDWITQLNRGALIDYERFGRYASEKDSVFVEQQLFDIGAPRVASAIAEGYGEYLGRANVEAGFAALSRVPEGVRDGLLNGIIRGWARYSPDKAGEYLETDTSHKNHIALVDVLIDEWSDEDPVAASEWLGRQQDYLVGESPELLINNPIDTLIRKWASVDPYMASSWLGTLHDGKATNQSAVTLIERAIDLDVIAAVEWTASITDEHYKRSALDVLFLNLALRHDAQIEPALEALLPSLSEKDLSIVESAIQQGRHYKMTIVP